MSSTPHTSFGSVDVRGPSGTGSHWVTDRPESVLIEDVDVRRVDVRFGWGDSERPYCGKCRSPMRAVDRGDGVKVWVTQDGSVREPYCTHTTYDDALSDEDLVEHMWHEPDRSVGSWCHGAAIHVDDASGTLKLVARTERHKVVVDVRRLPDGEVHVQTVRKRRRRRTPKAAS